MWACNCSVGGEKIRNIVLVPVSYEKYFIHNFHECTSPLLIDGDLIEE